VIWDYFQRCLAEKMNIIPEKEKNWGSRFVLSAATLKCIRSGKRGFSFLLASYPGLVLMKSAECTVNVFSIQAGAPAVGIVNWLKYDV
jgi:hypothetical protein